MAEGTVIDTMTTFLQLKISIARLLTCARTIATFPGRYLRRRQVRLVRRSQTAVSIYWKAIDSRMIIDPDTFFAEAYIQGIYEPNLVQYIKNNVRPGMICVDVGANVGFFTLLMAKLVQPGGRVIAFEPTSRVFEVLKRNVQLNGLIQVDLEQTALSSSSGMVDFQEGPAGFEVYNTIGKVTHPNAIDQSFVTSSVKCERLETYLGARGLQQVDFIKIDVEGAELSVLSGMERILKLNPQCQLVVEFADETTQGLGYNASDIGRWFVNRGWQLYVIGKGGNIKPIAAVDHEWHGELVVASQQKLL